MRKGEIVALLGANASGKSTTVKAISGLIDRVDGTIVFEGETIDALPAHKRAELGLIQVPEGRQLFSFLTVRENLEMGAYTKNARAHLKDNLEKVFHYFRRLKVRASNRRYDVWWRTANVCDRPWTDVEPETTHAR